MLDAASFRLCHLLRESCHAERTGRQAQGQRQQKSSCLNHSSIIAAFCFSSLGLLISAPPTDNPSNIMMLSSMIKFPLLFISGIFVPISSMGKWKFISYISPLTYYTDLARYSIGGTNNFSPIVDLLALLGFSILFFIIAIRWHKKSLTKRF